MSLPQDHFKVFTALLALLVYIDDVLITRNCERDITGVKRYLNEIFSIKDLGHVHYFLGLEIVRSKDGTYVNQRKYILDVLSDAGLLGCKTVDTPLPKNCKLVASQVKPLAEPEKYRRLVGRLLYMNFTRPDITYVVQQLSQFVEAPCQEHWDAALHVLRYLKGCLSKGI